MITSGRTMDDHLVSIAHRLNSNELSEESGIPCEGSVHFSRAFMSAHSWYDQDNPGRPYMQMLGECQSLRGDMPYGVTELRFKDNEGIPIQIAYEFTDDQLANLVKKGLYHNNFKCPDILTSNFIDIPMYVDVMAIQPDKSGVPIVFADVEDRMAIETNMHDCGYDFAEYFDKVEEPKEPVVSEEDMINYDIEDIDDIDNFDNDKAHENVQQQVVQQQQSAQEQVEPEVDEETKRLRKRYENIHARVMSKHINKEHVKPQHKAHMFDTDENKVDNKQTQHNEIDDGFEDFTDDEKQIINDAVNSIDYGDSSVDSKETSDDMSAFDTHAEFLDDDEFVDESKSIDESSEASDLDDELGDLSDIDDDLFAEDDSVDDDDLAAFDTFNAYDNKFDSKIKAKSKSKVSRSSAAKAAKVAKHTAMVDRQEYDIDMSDSLAKDDDGGMSF